MAVKDLFENGVPVRGISLTELLSWATNDNREISKFGRLALPPVQRSPVWGPKQILDLWDSAFRGLPLGSFYLVHRLEGDLARGLQAGSSTTDDMREGWSLLDGQQRLRAFLAGWMGPPQRGFGPDMRCIWMELGSEAGQRPLTLHLTSNSQPFGYDPTTGQKLPKEARRNSRTPGDYRLGDRDAYDHELFEGILDEKVKDAQGNVVIALPSPTRANKTNPVFRLDQLLSVWRTTVQPENFEQVCRRNIHLSTLAKHQVAALARCFKAMDQAPIALVRVEVSGQDNNEDGESKSEQLLRLFDRIGSGGTRLGDEERLFSVYKSHVPTIDNAVQEIYRKTGRVLSPTKICGAAIRVAQALTHQDPADGNYRIGILDFMKHFDSFHGLNGRCSTLKEELAKLIPEPSVDRGPLAVAFEALFDQLGQTQNGLPAMMRANLNHNLVEVLVFATVIAQKSTVPIDFWSNAIRFALVWQLCAIDDNHAAAICFGAIRQSEQGQPDFRQMYAKMVSVKAAYGIVTCKKMRQILCLDKKEVFVSWSDRFVLKAREDRASLSESDLEVAARWWSDRGIRLQRWQQRHYLNGLYNDFDPAFGSDEDTPFDIDHIVPRSGWGGNWQTFWNSLQLRDQARRNDYRLSRREIGESIGNKWLIDAGANRGAQDEPLEQKLQRLRDMNLELAGVLMAVLPEPLDQWFIASTDGAGWNETRLAAFQTAIERRAAALYCDFYISLGLNEWEIEPPVQEL